MAFTTFESNSFIYFSNQLSSQLMNKGHHFVKEILKAVELESSSHSQADSQDNEVVKYQQLSAITQPQKQKRLGLVKKERDIYKRIFKLYPSLATSHIYRLFGILGINERSLDDPGFEQSYFNSFFNGRIIKKVQFYSHSIVLQMSPVVILPNQPPVEYFINKNKSKGVDILFQLANQISDVYELYKTMSKYDKQEEKSESVKKCLDSLGDSMYVCMLGVNKLAISKSLLTYLQYDLEEFGIEAIKYKTVFHELFSANNYINGTIHIVKNMKHIVQLFQNKISQSQFYKKATMKFSDFIYSKTGVRSFCDMSFRMLNPTFFCHQINYIYYKEGETRSEEVGVSKLRLAIEDQQQRMRQNQYRLIKKVKHIPSHMLRQNQSLIASYREIEQQKKTGQQNQ